MTASADSIPGVLKKFEEYLRRKQLAPNKVQPYLVQWTRGLLYFAGTSRGVPFDEATALYWQDLGKRDEAKDW